MPIAKGDKETARVLGSTGGYRRAARLRPERRVEIARKAVEARWAKARERAKAAEELDRRAREIAIELYGDPYIELDSVVGRK